MLAIVDTVHNPGYAESVPTSLPRIGKPATSALAAVGIESLEGVSEWSRADLLALHGVGAKALALLDEALTAAGLAFRSTDPSGTAELTGSADLTGTAGDGRTLRAAHTVPTARTASTAGTAPTDRAAQAGQAVPVDAWTIAMSFDGAESRPHFDRVAVRARIIFASFTADGDSANLALTLDEQTDFCARCAGFAPVANAWGRKGWTAVDLLAATEHDVREALTAAHSHAL